MLISTDHARQAARGRSLMAALLVASAALCPVAQAHDAPVHAASQIAPLNEGDEPVTVTQHRIRTRDGWLDYEARVGRIPIRHDESGEIMGYVGFMAYHVKPKAGEAPRPISFLWNGGANSTASLVQFDFAGPRLLREGHMVDNPDTLLRASDLVFYDPVGTGFSRPGKPEYITKFLSILGDWASTTEFVRAYRQRLASPAQPVFLIGESTGTWRAAGVLDVMAKRKDPVAGIVMLSGTGGVTSRLAPAFGKAAYVTVRTATAFALGKLDADLMKDRDATMRQVNQWIEQVYEPALTKGAANIPVEERRQIAAALARYTGLSPADVPDTLIVSNLTFRKQLFAGDPSKILNMYDMRKFGTATPVQSAEAIGRYIRDELGYRTAMAYTPHELGYMPKPGPDHRDNFSLFTYDYRPGAQEEYKHNVSIGEGPPPAEPWLEDGMKADKGVQVMFVTGRYDSLNGCEANARSVPTLGPALAARIVARCYEGGHMMYEVPETQLSLSADVLAFIRSTVAKKPLP